MPDAPPGGPRYCSQCGGPVVVPNANYCKDCGAPLGTGPWLREDITWHPLVAAGLSIIPGLGHLYRGRRFKALVWFVGVMLTYSIAPSLGLLMHLICAGSAAFSGALREEAFERARRRSRTSRRRWSESPLRSGRSN